MEGATTTAAARVMALPCAVAGEVTAWPVMKPLVKVRMLEEGRGVKVREFRIQVTQKVSMQVCSGYKAGYKVQVT